LKRKVGDGGSGDGDLDPADLVDNKRGKGEGSGKKKRKGNGSGLRNHDRTIFGLDLPHAEVRASCAARNTEEYDVGVSGIRALWKFQERVFLCLNCTRETYHSCY
jgi:hypothetical protein